MDESTYSTGVTSAESEAGTEVSSSFTWVDYAVLITSLVASGFIGVYYGIKQRKSNSVDQFLVAGRSMPVFPVSVSLFVSWMSAISFIGDPVEVYKYGSVYWIMAIGYILAVPVVAHVFGPAFYRMKLISVNELLGVKHGSKMVLFILFFGSCSLYIYLGVALYAPSIAMGQMCGIDSRLGLFIIGGICTIYTSLGGMKAVLWADTIQTGIMLAGMVACLVEATRSVGGMDKVWKIAQDGGRINFWKFDPNPLARATVWTYLIGGFFRVLNPYISSQAWVQRYVSVKSERDMKLALYLNIPMYILFVSIFALTGLVMYAYFHDCDPLVSGRITDADQMLPLMVMETLGRYPGVPGLFLATLCSAALSSLSSGQNALAAICLRDIAQPLYKRWQQKEMGDKMATWTAIIFSFTFGLGNIGIGLVILELRETSIFALAYKVTGSFWAPVAGTFVLTVLFPRVGTPVTFISTVIGLIVNVWLVLGSFLDPPSPYPGEVLPSPIEYCPLTTTGYNFTTPLPTEMNYTTSATSYQEEEGLSINMLYKVSPALFSALGCILVVVIGVATTGGIELLRLVRRKISNRRFEPEDAQTKHELAPLEKSSPADL